MRSIVRFSFAVMAALLLSVAFSAPQVAMAQTDQPNILVISETRFSGPSAAAGAVGAVGFTNTPSTDEYVEICNPSINQVTIVSSDGSGGFGLYARNPFGGAILIFTIPNGTTIQAGRCVLGVGQGFSLRNYPGAEGPFQTQMSLQANAPGVGANAAAAMLVSGGAFEAIQYTGDIQDNTGIALFTSNNVTFSGTGFASATAGQNAVRLDAFGFRAVASATNEPTGSNVFREGAGVVPISTTGSAFNTSQYAYVRMNNPNADTKRDNNDNVADFFGGRPVATGIGTTNANIVQGTTTISAGSGETNVPVILGAPGPEDLGAPRDRRFTEITGAFDNFDPGQGAIGPNRERNTAVPNDTGCAAAGAAADVQFQANVRCAQRGTFLLRITLTNSTGAALMRLRSRIVDLSTVNRGLAISGTTAEGDQAILRAIDSNGGAVFVNSGADFADASGNRFTATSTTANSGIGGAGFKFVNGLVVERQISQPNGGGVNTGLVIDPDSNQGTFSATPAATTGTASPRSLGGLGAAGAPETATPSLATPIPSTRQFSLEYRFGVERSGRFLLLLIQEADNGAGT